jgi:glycosyltransferase involved in cell wall biosynthesis
VSAPDVSIVIPVYNEERIVRAAVLELREQLSAKAYSCEIVLAENGSRDGTAERAAELARELDNVRTLSVGEPNYGLALRRGIAEARGALVICEEIDLCDVDFHGRAIEMLRTEPVDMVIGSKLLAGSADERPWRRHAASQLYNGLLRVTLGFRGTDTHGLKAFRKSAVGPIAEQCVVDKDVFASELVIRAYRAGLAVREIPVRLREKRPPSVHLVRRVPNVLRNLAKLGWAIRFHG